MIFDMTRRSSGGGSGPSASDAILTVTVSTGSTVTMTKGSITLTPTMWVQAADNTLDCALFVISPSLFDAVNAWTVTATLSDETASDTVTIDSNEQYELFLPFIPCLIKAGSLYGTTDIAKTSTNWGNDSTISIDKTAPVNFTFHYGYGIYLTQIDVTDLKTLYIESKLDVAGTLSWAYFGVSTDTLWYDNAATNMGAYKKITAGYAQTVNSFDVSALYGNYYVKYYGWINGNATATLYNVYFER